jgi:hypothetical protein
LTFGFALPRHEAEELSSASFFLRIVLDLEFIDVVTEWSSAGRFQNSSDRIFRWANARLNLCAAADARELSPVKYQSGRVLKIDLLDLHTDNANFPRPTPRPRDGRGTCLTGFTFLCQSMS